MRDWFFRLRAALTPQTLLFIAAVFLGMMLLRGSAAGSASLERRAASALSAVSGAGNVQVVIHARKEESASTLLSGESHREIPCGAVAVAQGAGDPLVAMALQDALCALLGLPASAVSIVEGGK